MTLMSLGLRRADGSLNFSALAKAMSPGRWKPSLLLATFTLWVFIAEFVDMFVVHHSRFATPTIEAAVDGTILLIFLSPAYFLFYLPLKIRWQQERAAQREVQLLNRKLFETAEDERRKLALELHDHFGQSVTEMQCRVEKVLGQLKPSESTAREEVVALRQSVEQIGHDIRKFASSLRPEILDDMGLIETLKWHVREVVENHPELQIDFDTAGVKKRFSSDTEITIYRVCQESLHNIVKHANASQASVTLVYSHPELILTVRDDGDGLPARDDNSTECPIPGLGLLGMRERLTALGGTFEVNSKPGERTTVRAMIPVNGAV